MAKLFQLGYLTFFLGCLPVNNWRLTMKGFRTHLHKITEILRALWLVKKPIVYCTGKHRVLTRSTAWEIGSSEHYWKNTFKKLYIYFRLSLAEISIARISFNSTYTLKFARKNRTRIWSQYKAWSFSNFHGQNFTSIPFTLEFRRKF